MTNELGKQSTFIYDDDEFEVVEQDLMIIEETVE